MLMREGEDRSNEADQKLGCILAAVAGAINTTAFQTVGFFAGNMTGNVSSFSDRIAVGDYEGGVFFLGIVSMFISGAAASTLLINAGRRRRIESIHAVSIFAEGLLIAVLGVVNAWYWHHQRGTLLVLGLSFAMGLQNAIVTRISNARVRTTHVSGMATDIGIELGMLLDIALGRELPANAASNRDKLRLHCVTVLSFIVGGIVGMLAYGAIGDGILFVAGTVLCAIATADMFLLTV